MIDKVILAAENCWTSECQDLRRDMGGTIKEAYIRGFKRGIEKVRNRQPQTKADKIRAMSDDELADYHTKLQLRDEYGENETKMAVCKSMWLDWLKSRCSDD